MCNCYVTGYVLAMCSHFRHDVSERLFCPAFPKAFDIHYDIRWDGWADETNWSNSIELALNRNQRVVLTFLRENNSAECFVF